MTDSSDGISRPQLLAGSEDEDPDQRLTFDVVAESGDWRAFEPITNHLERVSFGVIGHVQLPAQHCEVCLALCSDDAVRKLNAQYRGKDSPTNVLSFPSAPALATSSGPQFLGDLAVAEATLRREAEAAETPLADHFTHIVLHGLLHLLGFDHQNETEAREMEQLEVRILTGLGIADPYAQTEVMQA